MASFDTLREQERHYIQILVEKIVALRPDLVLVGQAVSRQAQEYLEQHEVGGGGGLREVCVHRGRKRAGGNNEQNHCAHVNGRRPLFARPTERLQLVKY